MRSTVLVARMPEDLVRQTPPDPESKPAGRRPWIGYAAVIPAIVVGAAFQHLIQQPLGGRVALIFYYPVVVGAAWLWGLGPALWAVLLGVAAGAYLQPSLLTGPFSSQLGLILFVLIGLVLAVGGHSQRSARNQVIAEIEARVEVASELETSRELLETTLRSIGDAVIATDAGGRVTFLNPRAEQLTGWTEAEARGHPCGEVFHIVNEQTRARVESPVERAIREGAVVGLANHTVLIGQDGVERPIDDSGAPIHGCDGKVHGAVVVFRDIAERRKDERERRHLLEQEQQARAESERSGERLRFLAGASRILASSLDYQETLNRVAELAVPTLADWCDIQMLVSDGSISRVAITHRDPAKISFARELEGRYPTDLSQPRGLGHVLRTGESELYPEIPDELLVASAQDEEHLRIIRELGLRSALVVPLAARDRILGAITLVYAESNRQYGEQDRALAEELGHRAGLAIENSRLYTEAQDAVKTSAEALALHQQLEHRLTLLAEATSTLLGSLEEQSVLDNLLTLSHRLISADAYAIWRRDADRGHWKAVCSFGLSDHYRTTAIESMNHNQPMPDRPLVVEHLEDEALLTRHRSALSQEGIQSMHVLPLHIRGEISGTLAFYYRERHTFNSIELKVASALSNLASAAIGGAELYGEIRQRVEQLAEADRLKNEFLAMLAHELRNPLGAISNAAQVIGLASSDSTAFRRSLEVVSRQTRHMSRLVDELLDVSRISRGKVKPQMERLDLVPLVEATCEDHRRILENARLTLEIALPPSPLWVDGDPTRLRQIVGNLLQNTAKFTDPGGYVHVSAGPDPSELRAIVSVEDNGIGVAPELLPRLFEPFVQGDRSLDRVQGGLGLGLALVKGIAELHGGAVSARSDGLGKGATFSFELPLQSGPEQPRVAAPVATARNSTLRALVIEDNRDAAVTLKDMLELAGHQVQIAFDGAAGLDDARRWRPDLVLCDLGLPGMDGFTVAVELRKTPETARLFLVAVSGYGPDDLTGREDVFDAYLTKPVDIAHLSAIVEQAEKRVQPE